MVFRKRAKKSQITLNQALIYLSSSIAGFSVTPFKIDQNKDQNRSIDKVQNLGNERRYIYKDPRLDSGERNSRIRDIDFRQTNYYKLTFKLQRTANEYAAKSKIYKRPDQQIYTLSRHSEFCKADRATAVDSCFALCGRKGRNRCLWLRPRSVFGPFGVVLMSCKVSFHVVRSALQNSVCLLKLLQLQSPWKIFCHSNISTWRQASAL